VGTWRLVALCGPQAGSAGFRIRHRDLVPQSGALFVFRTLPKERADARHPRLFAFETGANKWRRYPSWPPPGAQPKSLYLHANGKISFDPPSAQEASYDEYVSDPARPVPYIEHPRTNLDETYMYGDQRFAAARPDVLTYRTEPLSEDLTVAGPLAVLLQVSSSGSDSEFVVKLIDEGDSPTTGFQQLIRGEPMRARFRNPFSSRKPWSRIR
jgi:uncharacterized protein